MTELLRPDFPKIIDSTIRKDGAACGKLLYYAHFRHLRPRGISPHLHFGACFAKGLETFRLAHWGDQLSVLDAFGKACTAIILAWGDYEPPPAPRSGHLKTMETCLVALQCYLEEYSPDTDPFPPFMTDTGPAVEWTFAIPIPGTSHPQTGEPLLYAGRFDMLAQSRGRNAVYIEDDKTASQLGASWANNWRLASQMTGYTWAGKTYGYPIAGIIIRGVAILTRDIKHQMLIEQRPQWMIDRWLAQLQKDIASWTRQWESGEWDYTLDGSCSNYGGCTYLPLCTSQFPEKWVDSDYEVKPWNPLAKDTA